VSYQTEWDGSGCWSQDGFFYSLVYFGFAKASEGWHAWGLMAAYGLYYDLTEGVAKALLPIWWILSAAVPPMVSIMPQWELQHFPPV